MLNKKNTSLVMLFIFCFISLTFNFYAEGYDNYNIIVNNSFIDKSYKVLEVDGILYIPLEPLQKYLNLNIYRASGLIEVHFDGNILRVDKDASKAFLNNNPIIMDYPLTYRDNLTYIPIIYVQDIMNYTLELLTEIKYIRIISRADALLAGEIINNYIAEMEKQKEKETAEQQELIKEQQNNQGNEDNKSKDKEKDKEKPTKVAYLTFDDGIDRKITPKVLDVLKKYEVKATFFILGNTIEKNKDILKRMAQEGHSIGNHTYSHKKEIIYGNVENFKEELKKTSNLIYEVIKKEVKIFRPPYGAAHIKNEEYKNALKGYKTILWNVDSKDSSSSTISSKEIVNNVIAQVRNKSSAIIIMHDSSSHSETLKALPEIIEYLQDNGFSIKVINENTTLRYEF